MEGTITLGSSAEDFLASIPRLDSELRDSISTALAHPDFDYETVEDLALCTLEQWDQMMETCNFKLGQSKLNLLQKYLGAVDGLAGFTWSTAKGVPSPGSKKRVVKEAASVADSDKSHKRDPVISRPQHAGLHKPIVPKMTEAYGKIIGKEPLCSGRMHAIIMLQALEHGPDLCLAPTVDERRILAKGLKAMFPTQSQADIINWESKVHNFWRNWNTGRYPVKYPFPQLPHYDAIIAEHVRRDCEAFKLLTHVRRMEPDDILDEIIIAKHDRKWLDHLQEKGGSTNSWLLPCSPSMQQVLTRDISSHNHLFQTLLPKRPDFPTEVAKEDDRTYNEVLEATRREVAAERRQEKERRATKEAAGNYAVLHDKETNATVDGASCKWQRPKVDLKTYCKTKHLRLTDMRKLLTKKVRLK